MNTTERVPHTPRPAYPANPFMLLGIQSVCMLTALVCYSKLGNNSLRGTIPSALQMLSALEYLYLLDNPLISGTIVSSILELSSMAYMCVLGRAVSLSPSRLFDCFFGSLTVSSAL